MGAKIYNSDCTKDLAQNAGIQQMTDKVPDELAEKIVPTFETNPLLLRRNNILGIVERQATAASASVIFASPAGKKTFITGIEIYMIKDAACDKASGHFSLNAAVKGSAAQNILKVPVLTLTAQSETAILSLAFPLEIEPLTSITLNSFSFAAGNCINGAVVYGYTINNANS